MLQRSLFYILGCGLLAAPLLVGCGRGMVAAENPAPVERSRYEALFERSVRVLRERGFTVDRQDRRFGVITTEPRTSPSFLEPWHGDNTTGQQVLGSTLNHRRRVIRIEIQPRSAAEGGGNAGGDPTAAGGPGGKDYQLRVVADVQQRIVPTAELTTAAVREVTLRDRRTPRQIQVTERGPAESFWEPIGRDPHYERRLVHTILRQGSAAADRRDDEEPAVRQAGT